LASYADGPNKSHKKRRALILKVELGHSDLTVLHTQELVEMRPELVGRKVAALTMFDPFTQRPVELDKILSRADLRGDHPQPSHVFEFA
jgi:hypothetical protein